METDKETDTETDARQGPLSLPQVSLTHGRKGHLWDEIVLHKVSQTSNLLILPLHHLDMLGELDDTLAIWLEPELSNNL